MTSKYTRFQFVLLNHIMVAAECTSFNILYTVEGVYYTSHNALVKRVYGLGHAHSELVPVTCL